MLKTRRAAHQDLQSRNGIVTPTADCQTRRHRPFTRLATGASEIYDSKMVLSIPTARSVSDKHLLGIEHCKQALDWDRVLTNLSDNIALARGEINRSCPWIDEACS
jgi:hypothetical protein